MPDSRLERTRKLYQELNVRLPDTTKPHWWTEEYESTLSRGIKQAMTTNDQRTVSIRIPVDRATLDSDA